VADVVHCYLDFLCCPCEGVNIDAVARAYRTGGGSRAELLDARSALAARMFLNVSGWRADTQNCMEGDSLKPTGYTGAV
jgi:hypothetical protein